MPTDDKHDQSEMGEDPLRSLMLLTLPWLSLQRDVLEFAKKSVQDASCVKPAEKFTFSQLHALMMVLDPSRRFRSRYDSEFENKLRDTYNELLPKLTSASVQILDAQQQALKSLSEGLNKLRTGTGTKDRSRSED